MGYICNHAIVVTSWHEPSIGRAHDLAMEIFQGCVSEIVFSQMNGVMSFFIPPDGSKEGWPESDAGDARRQEFVEKLAAAHELWVDWVEVQYGDDYHHTEIVRDSDHYPEESC